MSKETPFANRKLLEDDTTNNERNEMEEGLMEENEIEEGHDNVEEEQDNKAKDTPFANRKLLEDDTTNSEKNEMEEGQMQENEIKEGHENVEEEQDYKWPSVMFRKMYSKEYNEELEAVVACLSHVYKICVIQPQMYWPRYACDYLMTEGQMEEYNKKESQKKLHDTFVVRSLNSVYGERKQAFEEMKIKRLEIENFWKHALEKDMDIMRILKSGSLRFLKQQIQNLDKLIRCKVCLDSDACMVCFPCRHMATCEYCGSFLDQCPVCRTLIEKTEKVNKK